jgi:hypothetical protein
MRSDVHIASQWIDYLNFMFPLAGSFNKTSGRIKLGLSGKDADFHFAAFLLFLI